MNNEFIDDLSGCRARVASARADVYKSLHKLNEAYNVWKDTSPLQEKLAAQEVFYQALVARCAAKDELSASQADLKVAHAEFLRLG